MSTPTCSLCSARATRRDPTKPLYIVLLCEDCYKTKKPPELDLSDKPGDARKYSGPKGYPSRSAIAAFNPVKQDNKDWSWKKRQDRNLPETEEEQAS